MIDMCLERRGLNSAMGGFVPVCLLMHMVTGVSLICMSYVPPDRQGTLERRLGTCVHACMHTEANSRVSRKHGRGGIGTLTLGR